MSTIRSQLSEPWALYRHARAEEVSIRRILNSAARGKNSGRQLARSAVLCKLTSLGTVDGGSFSAEKTIELDPRWKRQNMKASRFWTGAQFSQSY